MVEEFVEVQSRTPLSHVSFSRRTASSVFPQTTKALMPTPSSLPSLTTSIPNGIASDAPGSLDGKVPSKPGQESVTSNTPPVETGGGGGGIVGGGLGSGEAGEMMKIAMAVGFCFGVLACLTFLGVRRVLARKKRRERDLMRWKLYGRDKYAEEFHEHI